MSEPMGDVAHIAHGELLTPAPEQSLAFFVDLFGMEVEAREGQSVRPDWEPIRWTEAERARGQARGVRTVESFHVYGAPDVSGRATGPPIPPTSRIPG